jgi:hypothetical protein
MGMHRLPTAAVASLLLVSPAPAAAPPAGWRELSLPAASGAQAPRLSTSAQGSLLTWLEPATGGAQVLRLARLQDDSWLAMPPVTSGADLLANWADTPVVAQGGDGALYAAWLVKIGRGYGVSMARSSDRGGVWRELGWLHADRSEAEHGFVSLVPEPGGVRAFWLGGENAEKEGGAMSLRTAAVAPTIRDERVLDERVCDCCSTGATVGSGGPLVVFRDRSKEEIRDIAVARLDTPEGTAPKVAADRWRLLGCPVNGPDIAARGSHLAVAWFTAAQNTARVHLAFSSDGGKRFGKPARIDGGRPLGRVGIALDGDDAIVSWLEQGSEAAEVRLRRVTPDERTGEAITVAQVPATRASGVPRILVDGSRLVVAWTDPGPGGKGSQLRTGVVPLASIPPPR